MDYNITKLGENNGVYSFEIETSENGKVMARGIKTTTLEGINAEIAVFEKEIEKLNIMKGLI